MTDLKNDLADSLQKARESGKLHTDNLREIVGSAVSRAAAEMKEGSDEITSIARTALTTVTEVLHERGTEFTEETRASIEGIIRGIRERKRGQIAGTRDEIGRLQEQLDREESAIHQEIDTVLDDLQKTATDSPNGKSAIDSIIRDLKDREEVALLQQQYARLQSRLEIVRANLAERYGAGSEEVKKHLDEAKRWYERARENPELLTEPIQQKHREFEEKMANAGTSIAREERKIKQQLRELLHSIEAVFDRGKSDR